MKQRKLMTFIRTICSVAALWVVTAQTALAQPSSSVNLKKPKDFDNTTFRSEKSGEKKLTLPKRIMQNTYTHYNYYFNANNKMKEIIEKAKSAFKDDYTTLLPFYNYTLEGTSQQKGDIDSVIYKCTAGILLHDLRNDWIDNLYLLMGKAYMFRKDFDSATQTFQYLNYAYAPKDDGYDIAIGSNSSNTNGVFTIATKETKNVFKKMVSRPPSRNESFIWQARNYVEQGEFSDASGLIEILRADPKFPKRLQTELYEVLSYWFYSQKVYDSAAFYLSNALNEADDRQDKARWEYLIGQMYALSGKNDLAVKYFERSINHTVDPVMEVYARLNALRLNNSGKKDSFIQDNLNDLLKMARKDKYINYRDIIYYTAAKVELERNNIPGAIKWLKKSVETSESNPGQKAAANLLLADLSYDTRDYVNAADYYDSTLTDQLRYEEDKQRVNDRKTPLKTISSNVKKINLQDSLLRIAGMPEAERDAFIRKLVKQLRKAKGLKEEAGAPGGGNNTPVDLFADNKSSDWYFNNTSLKSKGFTEFKARWGDRPNVDNWRRKQAVDRNAARNDLIPPDNDVGDSTVQEEEISFESLMAKLPLTEEKKAAANGIILAALYENGNVFQNKLEDYQSAIETFEALLKRYPGAAEREQILFSLYYLYGKMKNPAKQQEIKQLLEREFPNSNSVELLKEGKNTGSKKADAATRQYEQIYNLFIAGNFNEAIAQKTKADSLYGNSYWTPQLLFIEAIYYIKQKADSTAINRLTAIKTNFSTSPLAEKAGRMIDVLQRRKEIESYLTNLEVERKENEPVKRVDMNSQQIATKPVDAPKDITNKTTGTDKPVTVKMDSIAVKPAVVASANQFNFIPADPQYAAVVLDQVDGMYVNEVKNAFIRFNGEKFYSLKLTAFVQPINGQYNLVLIGPFADAGKAMDYVDKTKPQTPSNILPWLNAGKYSFLIISSPNLTLLKENKDIPGYRQFLTQLLPNKF